MAKDDESFWDKLFSSAGRALNPLNVLGAILKFIIFGLIIGTPYLVMNLNDLSQKIRGANASGMVAFWFALRSIFKTVWQGVFVGLSTVWDAFLRIGSVVGNLEIGTIVIVLIVVIFTTLTLHQPLSIFFDIVDLKKDKAVPKIVTLFISFVLTLVVLSPLAYYVILHGQTITSGVMETDLPEGADKGNYTEDNGTTTVPEDSLTINLNFMQEAG